MGPSRLHTDHLNTGQLTLNSTAALGSDRQSTTHSHAARYALISHSAATQPLNVKTPQQSPEDDALRPRAVVLLSGGLDSATCAAQAVADGYSVIALSFNYGQRHDRELAAAKEIAQALDIEDHRIIDINLAQWGGSSLTDNTINLPTSGVDTSEIPSTYVPGRNTVFIAIALSLAEAQSAEAIYLGINAIDYSGYPDCRPEYLAAFQNLATLSSKAGLEGQAPDLVAPLVMDSKTDIVKRALHLGIPIEKTWSCYEGGQQPCGRCDSCRIRDAALIRAGRADLATAAGREAGRKAKSSSLT